MYFYPRSPCGERPIKAMRGDRKALISIHALLAESDAHEFQYLSGVMISIHALLAESDPFLPSVPMTRQYFYPRSPCGERLHNADVSISLALAFLSTLSLRRATAARLWCRSQWQISIHALLAESDVLGAKRRPCMGRISIHALLAESDC